MEDEEQAIKIKKLKDTFLKRKMEKLQEEYDRLMAYYQSKLDKYNARYYRKQKEKRDDNRYVRILKRRASDGPIGFRRIYEPFYEKLAER